MSQYSVPQLAAQIPSQHSGVDPPQSDDCSQGFGHVVYSVLIQSPDTARWGSSTFSVVQHVSPRSSVSQSVDLAHAFAHFEGVVQNG